MILDPLFYAAAIPAVIIVGLSKGGFAGGVGLLGVPLIALAVPPLQAAAIMLPILLVMDVVALISWRGTYHRATLRLLVPAGLIGIAIGWLTAAWVTDTAVRLIVGLVALAFTLDYWFRPRDSLAPGKPNSAKGTFWGALSGFTSFVSHAGGPPFQMYALPLRLEPRLLAGTAVIFFAVINAAKVLPYLALGHLSLGNLGTSMMLMPLAALAAFAGTRLVRIIPRDLFYRITYVAVFMVSLKLIWDGVAGLL